MRNCNRSQDLQPSRLWSNSQNCFLPCAGTPGPLEICDRVKLSPLASAIPASLQLSFAGVYRPVRCFVVVLRTILIKFWRLSILATSWIMPGQDLVPGISPGQRLRNWLEKSLRLLVCPGPSLEALRRPETAQDRTLGIHTGPGLLARLRRSESFLAASCQGRQQASSSGKLPSVGKSPRLTVEV